MEKNRLKQYRTSTGDRNLYYHETTAVNDLAVNNSSAAMGNLADVMKNGPVIFPNILAPDTPKRILLGTAEPSNQTRKSDGKDFI